MDKAELKQLCKENKVYQWQIAEKLDVSEPTFIRWLRHPATGELESRIRKAVKEIVEERKQ